MASPRETFTIVGDLLDEDITIVLAFICVGCDHDDVSYDNQLGIISSWEVYIDGQVADRHLLSSVRAWA